MYTSTYSKAWSDLFYCDRPSDSSLKQLDRSAPAAPRSACFLFLFMFSMTVKTAPDCVFSAKTFGCELKFLLEQVLLIRGSDRLAQG